MAVSPVTKSAKKWCTEEEKSFACKVLPTSHAPAVGEHAGSAAAGERAPAGGRRRTDAVLVLKTEAYEALAVRLRCARWHAERQEGGRVAHADGR